MLNLIHNTVIKVDREPSYERILGRRSLVRAHLWRLDFVGQNQASQLNRETIHWAFRQYEHLHLQLTTDGLINVIVDHWNTYCPVIHEGKCSHEFRQILRDYYEREFFASYVKWYKAAGQKQADFLEPEAVWKGKAPESALIYDMALRMSIFRHLPETARTLSNVVNLFFHVARILISTEQHDKYKKLLTFEMRYLHEFMRLAGYQKGKHLDKYFTKDDLNTTCAVYRFVNCFSSEETDERFIYAFLDGKKAKDTNKINILLQGVRRMTLLTPEEQIQETVEKGKAYKDNPFLKEDEEKKDTLLRKSFIKRWKPYWDNHGWIAGYGTFIINSAVPFAIHLAVVGACLFLSEDDFYNIKVLTNPGFITLWMIPVFIAAVILTLHLIVNLLGNRMFLISQFYVHNSIFARRKTWRIKRGPNANTKHIGHCKNSDCDSTLLTKRVTNRSAFVTWLIVSLNNVVVWTITYILTFFLLKYALVPNIRRATYEIIDPNTSYLNHGTVSYWFLVVGLILAWAPVLLLSFTIIPIAFAIISCLYSAINEALIFARVELFTAPHSTRLPYLSWSNIRGYLHMGLNGIYSERVFKRRLRDKRTMRFFVEKVLFKTYNPDKTCPGLYMEHFAKVWNHIVEDLDTEYLLRKEMIDKRDNKKKSEKEIMTFVVGDKTEPTNWFYNTVDAICDREGVNETAQYQLSRFINYLWNPNMKPMQLVECMRALRIVIPVYNETIIETFDKITVVLNTNTSLMDHAIRKHHDEWSNFVMSFKDEKTREKLITLEAAVAAKTDNIGKMYLLKDTPNDKGDYEPDQELRMQVRLWVSNRFQYVCRTMKGAAKIQQSLRTLLSVQMDVMDDGIAKVVDQKKKSDFVRDVVSRKVRIIAGAQVYAMPWSQREEDLRAHRSYVEAINHLVGLYSGDGLNFCYQKITDDGFKAFIMTGIDENKQPIGREARTYGHKQNGFATMGQGKPLHQSFLLQFFDGSVVEAVDCNQDLNSAQAFLLPNALCEFDETNVKLVGFKEYITTINWSSAGLGAGYAEKVFGSIIQRSWTMLGGRLHYGHPDFIRGTAVMYETGMSNMDVVSEDIFLGMTILLTGGDIKYLDHYEIGKARDVCMDTTSAFQSKIAGGNPQVCNSRQMHHIMRIFAFSPIRQLTLFHTITSQYLGSFIILICCYLLAITRIILALIQLGSTRFWAASPYDAQIFGLADSYFWLQIGVSMSAPGFFQSTIDGGIREVITYVVYMKFLRQTAFGAFHLLNTATFFGKSFAAVPHYIASGRTAGLEHKTIDIVMKNYFKSHFRVCFHLATMLIIVFVLTLNWKPAVFNGIMIAIWMWSPFLFNHGSLSSNVGNKTWTKLSNENWKFVHRFGAYHLFPQVPTNRLQKAILKEKKRSTAARLLKRMEINGEKPSLEQENAAKIRAKWARNVCCGYGRFNLRVLAFFWDTYDMAYWLLFNYVYLVFVLTGLHYINIAVRLITLLIPFYALKPRDAEYEENRRKHVDSELLRMEQQLNEYTKYEKTNITQATKRHQHTQDSIQK